MFSDCKSFQSSQNSMVLDSFISFLFTKDTDFMVQRIYLTCNFLDIGSSSNYCLRKLFQFCWFARRRYSCEALKAVQSIFLPEFFCLGFESLSISKFFRLQVGHLSFSVLLRKMSQTSLGFYLQYFYKHLIWKECLQAKIFKGSLAESQM